MADIDAISETLEKIANLSLELKDWIDELDINPIIVYNKGKGLKAIDALIKLKASK
jgi:acetate---CoA ligase (ADP-forming)